MNMKDLYEMPENLTPVGKSDHDVVLCSPLHAYLTPAPKPEAIKVRSSGRIRRLILLTDL